MPVWVKWLKAAIRKYPPTIMRPMRKSMLKACTRSIARPPLSQSRPALAVATRGPLRGGHFTPRHSDYHTRSLQLGSPRGLCGRPDVVYRLSAWLATEKASGFAEDRFLRPAVPGAGAT